jgi:uncharacterized membrane protein YphA (DoxX/SURF4 family)
MCKRLSQDGKYDGGRRVLYAAQAAEFQDLQQVKAGAELSCRAGLSRISARSLVGAFILCGALVILGLLTRLASIVLLIDISVAIVSTKIPVLLGYGFWGFSLTKLPRYGFLSMVHEARTDFAMWFGLLFLIIVGAGKKWSLDAKFVRAGSEPGMLR